jgi:branched-chain amino acid aminotransferase/4-amino-4-deoxychorismate lyase
MSVEPTDRGLLLADGLFETVLWRGGLIDFAAHARRMQAGCDTLGLPAPQTPALEAAALAGVRAAGLDSRRAAVRLTWTAGPGGRGLDRPQTLCPTLFASAAPSPAPTGPARLITSEIARNDRSPASRLKTLAYLDNVLARRAARRAGADAALMLNTAGEIACADAANLFWFEGEVLVTPALNCGVLEGIVRAGVIDRARAAGLEVRETRVGRAALDGPAGLFLTNSLIGLRRVSALDGRALPIDPRVTMLSPEETAPWPT